MNMISLNKIIENHYPKFSDLSKCRQKLYLAFISKFIHFEEINELLSKHGDSKGIQFIDEAPWLCGSNIIQTVYEAM